MDDNAPNGPQRGHYEFDLDIQVETCIDEYEQALEAWWAAGGPTDQALSVVLLAQAKHFADSVLQATEELVPVRGTEYALVEPQFQEFIRRIEGRLAKLCALIEQTGLSADPFLAVLRDTESDIRPEEGTLLKVAWEMLLGRCMWEAVDRSRKAATRLLLLASLRVPSEPTKVTRSFLRQAAKCFVWGFDVPCIVFCRSAIDVALEDAGFRQRGLKDRIKEAEKAHLLDEGGAVNATKVKKLGDDAVHGRPLAMADVLDVIRKTLLVLQQITQVRTE